MVDLRTDLTTLAARVPATTTAVVDADVAGGRTAVRRRRTATTGAAAVAVAAVLVIGAALTTTTGTPVDSARVPAAGSGPAVAATTRAAPAPPFVPTAGLMSGPFSSRLAPAGWAVEDPTDTFALRLSDPTRPAQDVARLTVALLSLDATPPTEPAPLIVNGNPAWIFHDDQRLPQDQVHTLITQLADGRYLQVEYANAVGWTDQQVLGFTAGITVAPDAPRAHG